MAPRNAFFWADKKLIIKKDKLEISHVSGKNYSGHEKFKKSPAKLQMNKRLST